MERDTVRKVIRAASLSLLLVTATGVAGLEMFATSPAMAQPNGPGNDPAQGTDPVDPTSVPATPTSANPAPGPTDGIVPSGVGLPAIP
ncbi:MAG: hypothetical protein ACRDRO_30685 [Pseudonocardiaceae bacterium]